MSRRTSLGQRVEQLEASMQPSVESRIEIVTFMGPSFELQVGNLSPEEERAAAAEFSRRMDAMVARRVGH